MIHLDIAEKFLEQGEQDLHTLRELHKTLERIEANRSKLDAYYRNQYREDYDNASPDKHYRVLDQDSIWNVLTDQYNEKIKILKSIINSI